MARSMDVSDVAVGEVGKGDAVQSRWRQVLHPKLQFSLNICLLGLWIRVWDELWRAYPS
jgi:hypothetical protein